MKNPVAVIYCDCFQTFVEKENFFEKDACKFIVEILLGVPNVCSLYRLLAKLSVSRKLKVKSFVVIKFGKYYRLQD